ncbi:zinc ABC transporter substrate-binding protein [Pseudomonas alliivorans]|nr:zinc ABC transporter substrate-binding protein [Pseudomonas alliivorans]MEE4670243.1 zinc ABC transporter substrate-binding protein [Pseudomonas alliivorans]MEE5063668.1 zinc ABC transporter substrate-binding protein [Pseudomonas alliivorans]MEE5166325.1 zinc ABC transporter substrate-binding protein [Pseudomonas alliivorans]
MFTLRRMTLALAMTGLLCNAVSASDVTAQPTQPVRVLASLPITYGLGQILLKDSGVVLERAAAANLPGSRQTAYFTGRGAEALRGLAVEADAVIGLRSIWADDPLYPNARRSNIRIVEIDAARPVDGSLPGIAVQPGQGVDGLNSQPWLASNNMGRMADVMAADLVRLAPAAKPKIEGNLAALKQHLLKLSADSEASLASADNLSVVSLSDRFGYLISGLNLELIDSQALTDEQWTPEAIQKLTSTLKDNDVALVLDHRQPPEPVKTAIAEAGSTLLVLGIDGADPLAELQRDIEQIIGALKAG